MDFLVHLVNADSFSFHNIMRSIPDSSGTTLLEYKLTKCCYGMCNEYAMTFVGRCKPVCHAHRLAAYYNGVLICNHEYCVKIALYGYFEREYCIDHRKPDMVSLRINLCKHDKICNNRATYIHHANYKNRRCYRHKKPGMFSEQEFKCKHVMEVNGCTIECNSIATYYSILDPNKKPYKCQIHAVDCSECVSYAREKKKYKKRTPKSTN